jgi:peptidyl-prolyl cis-trans isomerase SurA
MTSGLALVLAAVLLTAACRSAPPPPPPASADAWAIVDGREIKQGEVDKAFRRLSDDSQTLSEDEALTAKMGVLDDLIMEEVLLSKARALKIEVPESEVDTAQADAKKNITEAAFQQELTKRNLTAADMREQIRRQLITRKLIEREVTSKITVTDMQVQEFFNANRAQFNLPEDAYRLAQIVVTPVRDQQIANRTGDDAATPQAAAAKVQMIMERLKAGTPFGDLARDFSEDPEFAPRGGDLGLVPLSRIKQAPPALRDATLNLEPGRARVVSGDGAYTIIYVIGREPAGQRDLSMPVVRQNITDALKARKEQLWRTAYLTAARTDAQVVNLLARRVLQSQSQAAAPPAAPAPVK